MNPFTKWYLPHTPTACQIPKTICLHLSNTLTYACWMSKHHLSILNSIIHKSYHLHLQTFVCVCVCEHVHEWELLYASVCDYQYLCVFYTSATSLFYWVMAYNCDKQKSCTTCLCKDLRSCRKSLIMMLIQWSNNYVNLLIIRIVKI